MRRNAPSPSAHKPKTTSGTSLSTQARESNRRTAQPEQRPEGQDASEVLCGAYHPLCLCARLVLCMTGVLKLDLAFWGKCCWACMCQGAKSSQVLTPQSCKEQGARIKKGGGMPCMIFRSLPVPPDVAPVGQLRRFDSLVTQRGPRRGLVLVCSGRRRIPPHRAVAPQIQRAPCSEAPLVPPPSAKASGSQNIDSYVK